MCDFSYDLSELLLNKRRRFRWVYCLLEILRQCFPASIHTILDHLPETLDETYEHTLHRINKVKHQFAHRLFQCLMVSVRPLRVEELAEILAVRFNEGGLPQFNTNWRLGDAEEAVLSACSSLITVTDVNGCRIVQFAHFSVKEFLTSDRLATATDDFSRYHIIPHLAHATLAQACLGVLLQLDDRIDRDSIRDFPLADYAARHWFEHGQIENVSSTIRDATDRLFDRERPHLSAWVWLYDLDDPWREPMPTMRPERPEAPPLYYAILCRLRWLTEHLIATYPMDIDARGGYYTTSWMAAFEVDDMDVVRLLLRSGADVNLLEKGGCNPLHKASENGRTDIVQLLLEHNADVDLPTKWQWTPLAVSSSYGHLEVSQLLVQHGANVNALNDANWTPLNFASLKGHLAIVRFLIDNGADVDSISNEGRTPLHSAARNGHLDVVKLLLESGADFNIRDDDAKTAWDKAFENGQLEVANFLSGCISATIALGGVLKPSPSTPILRPPNRPDTVRLMWKRMEINDEWTPLQTAAQYGQLDIVRSLLDEGSDVNETDNLRMTALHAASASGRLEIAKLLVERGAHVNSRSINGWTPLQNASKHGHAEITRLLLDHGAEVNVKTRRMQTALHLASDVGCFRTTLLLVEHGADLDARSSRGWTPRQEAMARGHHRVADFLLERSTYI